MFGSYCLTSKSHKYTNMMSYKSVFENHSKEDNIYPLTVKGIADAQKANIKIRLLVIQNDVLPKGVTLQTV